MRTYKGHTFHNVVTLGGLRAALAEVADMPDDTPVLHATDDANEDDSYEFVSELEIAWWDGEVQCEESEVDARKAIFL